MFQLREVNKEDIKDIKELFEIVSNKNFNISNTRKTNFGDHLHFVNNNPYRKWFIIEKNYSLIGSAYLTYQNVIGLNLLSADIETYIYLIKKISSKYKPLKEIKSIRNKNFTINVNPKNKILTKALDKLDMELIENTYLITNNQL